MAAEHGVPAGVGPPLRPIAPAFDRRVLALLHAGLPLLLRLRLFPWLPAGIRGLEVANGDTLSRCLHRFHAGEIRLILAFRHSEVDDPLAALWLLSRDQPRRARRLGLRIGKPVHAHFLFDRGMPLWGGAGLGWLLGGLGGVSLRRGRQPDWTALRQARRLVREGRFPFALAPEGATNGHGERIGPLEGGGSQLGLWCLEDLEDRGDGREVLILPIAIQYFCRRQTWRPLRRWMGSLERQLGLPPLARPKRHGCGAAAAAGAPGGVRVSSAGALRGAARRRGAAASRALPAPARALPGHSRRAARSALQRHARAPLPPHRRSGVAAPAP
jgi:hypothetical protein